MYACCDTCIYYSYTWRNVLNIVVADKSASYIYITNGIARIDAKVLGFGHTSKKTTKSIFIYAEIM